jgi:hypothetical protein
VRVELGIGRRGHGTTRGTASRRDGGAAVAAGGGRVNDRTPVLPTSRPATATNEPARTSTGTMHALAHGTRTFLPSLALVLLAVAFVFGALPALLAAAAGTAP